jgi:ABC-2 type transport system ATP-binding protein
MKEKVVQVISVNKEFGKIKAVRNLSFSIQKGEIFALLGPNGAGKTTMVRMLMGIIHPDSGEIKYSVEMKESKLVDTRGIGYLPEERGLYKDVPILKTLTYLGLIRGMDKEAARESARTWLKKLDLLDREKDKPDTLSKGNQQKVQFIAAILHNPEFVVLDEPFTGFDPVNQELFIRIIRELRENGTTVLLSAHHMHLVERVAERVLLMNKGENILSGTIENIKNEAFASDVISIKIEGDYKLDVLKKHPDIVNVSVKTANELEIYLNVKKNLNNLLKHLTDILNINEIRTKDISLHEIFINSVGEGMNND